MLDRTIVEPRIGQTKINFGQARVLIRVEPVEGQAIEVEIADAFSGRIDFDFEDAELRDAHSIMSPPLAVYKVRRSVTLSASGEPNVRVAEA